MKAFEEESSIWPSVKLEELCDVKGGKRLPAGTDFVSEKTKHPYIRVVDFMASTVGTDNLKYISTETHKLIDRYIIHYEDVYISIAGTIGTVGTIPRQLDGANLTENAARLVIRDQDRLDRDYLFRFLQSPNGQHQISLRTNTVGQPKLALSRISTIKIPLPPLAEQKRIVAILTQKLAAIAKARAAAEAQLAAAQALPAAYLRQLFESEEAQGWRRETIGDISTMVKDGPHVTPTYVTKGVPFVTVQNIISGRIDFSDVRYITPKAHAEFQLQGKAEPGDILYTKDGTLGIPCVVDTDEEFSFFVSVALIKLIKTLANPYYVAYALKSPDALKQVEKLATGSGLKHMVLKSIRALEIPLPLLGRQQEIVAKLNNVTEKSKATIKILSKQRDEINALPVAYLRQAFNGEL